MAEGKLAKQRKESSKHKKKKAPLFLAAQSIKIQIDSISFLVQIFSTPSLSMAEEARPTADDSGSKKKETAVVSKKQSSGGFFSRLWRGVFGSSSEDYEKKLQYLSKEEASVHARLKRKAHLSRKKTRNIIVSSVILEVIAAAYVIMTTRSVNLDWKMRASRVFPMFGLPILSTLIYSALVSFTRMLDRKDQKTLEKLRAERQAKIDELKEITNYYTTQQLIQRYDLDPAAKAAAATVLASKLGADSGLKAYLGDESNPRASLGRSSDVDLVKSTGLRNRKPSHKRSNNTGSAALTDEDITPVDWRGRRIFPISHITALIAMH